MKEVTVVIIIAYIVCFFPAFRTALAFYLFRDKDNTANKAMRYGFIPGLLSIWIIYPYFIIKDCFSHE